jgi:hypothetical protein
MMPQKFTSSHSRSNAVLKMLCSSVLHGSGKASKGNSPLGKILRNTSTELRYFFGWREVQPEKRTRPHSVDLFTLLEAAEHRRATERQDPKKS